MRFADGETKSAVPEKALNLQNELAAGEPANPEFQIQKINLLIRKGDVADGFENKFRSFLETIETAERLFENDSQNRKLKEILMKLYQRAGTARVWQGDEALKKGQPAENFYREALPFHKKSLEFAEAVHLADERNLPNRRRHGIALLNYAETSAKNDDLDEAVLEKAVAIFYKTVAEDPLNLEAVFDLAEANRIEAEIKLRFGERKEAIGHLEKTLELFQKIWRTDAKNYESRSGVYNAHVKLAALYKAENRPDKAAFHKREAEKLANRPPA